MNHHLQLQPQGTRTGFAKFMILAAILLLPASLLLARDGDDDGPFLPIQIRSASTIPLNGDVNPYGVAYVSPGFPSGGLANPGDILVSNFNNSMNTQGTGTTIVDISATQPVAPFFQFSGTGTVGLTTALNILRKGIVLVGNFPAPCGGPGTAGSILVVNYKGQQVGTITDPLINGPWDSAVFDQGDSAKYFVSNAFTGTVVRLDLKVSSAGVTVKSITQIASGYGHQCDATTFVDGPTGLAYDAERDVLYVASALDNEVFAVGDAGDTNKDRGRGALVYHDNAHLHGPLGMILASNGDLIVANNDAINSDPNQPSELVEFTKSGHFVKEISLDPVQGGSFGLASTASGSHVQLAAVDDSQNVLLIWNFRIH